jgi:hypothetical protein
MLLIQVLKILSRHYPSHIDCQYMYRPHPALMMHAHVSIMCSLYRVNIQPLTTLHCQIPAEVLAGKSVLRTAICVAVQQLESLLVDLHSPRPHLSCRYTGCLRAPSAFMCRDSMRLHIVRVTFHTVSAFEPRSV